MRINSSDPITPFFSCHLSGPKVGISEHYVRPFSLRLTQAERARLERETRTR